MYMYIYIYIHTYQQWYLGVSENLVSCPKQKHWLKWEIGKKSWTWWSLKVDSGVSNLKAKPYLGILMFNGLVGRFPGTHPFNPGFGEGKAMAFFVVWQDPKSEGHPMVTMLENSTRAKFVLEHQVQSSSHSSDSGRTFEVNHMGWLLVQWRYPKMDGVFWWKIPIGWWLGVALFQETSTWWELDSQEWQNMAEQIRFRAIATNRY